MSWLDILVNAICSILIFCVNYFLFRDLKRQESHETSCCLSGLATAPPFEASEYLARIQNEYFLILRNAQPVDWIITLWLCLEGLRIDPDGTSEWIRREPAPPPLIFAPPWDRSRIYAPPLPPWMLPDPPPPGVQLLYADNRIVECCCQPLQDIQESMDQIRAENDIKRLETQLD